MNIEIFNQIVMKLRATHWACGYLTQADIMHELGLESTDTNYLNDVEFDDIEAELAEIVDEIENSWPTLKRVIKNFKDVLGGKPYIVNEHRSSFDTVSIERHGGEKRMPVPKYMDIQEYLESIPGYESSRVGWDDACCHDYRLRTDFDPIITTERYPCGGMPKVKQSNLSMPKPKKMWSGYGRKGFSVTVEWEDGTKTTVTNPNETVTEFTGFCACVAKKIFGSTTKMMKAMEDAQTESKREFMNREHARKMEKERKAGWQEMKKRKHAEKVQARVEELRIAREAEAILAKEEEENDE